MVGGALTLVCHDCGENYDTAERIAAVADNSCCCVNLTCLADLSVAMHFERLDTGVTRR